MIQRIQTLYFIITALLAILFMSGSFATFNHGNTDLLIASVNGLNHVPLQEGARKLVTMMPLLILSAVIALLSIIVIFFFRKRKLQLKITFILILLIVLFIACFIFVILRVQNNYNVTLMIGYKLFIPLLMLIAAIMAYRGIKKDEELIKSYDRMR